MLKHVEATLQLQFRSAGPCTPTIPAHYRVQLHRPWRPSPARENLEGCLEECGTALQHAGATGEALSRRAEAALAAQRVHVHDGDTLALRRALLAQMEA